ncbi:MAG: FtsX-like permease family protein [Rhodobacterales bacterium]|nr:FtsX-like permease family protein [Rhodobacterales bacterium]NCT13502.1 FtsX-like permease family protein [Rhodobacterales bacterium]
MTGPVIAALWSHWRRNPLQLFTLLAGLALATALWSGVQAINAEARASYDAAAATLGEGRYGQLIARDGGVIAQDSYVALRRAGWLVSPVVEGRLQGVRLVGIDPLTAPGGIGPVTLGEGADIGAFLAGRGQVFAHPDAVAALADLDADVIVAPDAAPGTAVTDIGVAQRLLGREGQVSRLIVAPVQPLVQRPLAEVAPELDLRPARGGSDIGRLTDSFHLNLTAFGLLSFAVGIFIVHGAIGLAFEQRRPVVRTLRALGVPLGRLVWLMAAELMGLALVAGLAGVALGYVVAAALLPDVAATLRGLYGADVAGALTLRPVWLVSGIAIALGGTALAAGGALWRMTRMPLLASASPRAMSMAAGRGARLQAVGALGLLALAGALALWGSGLVAGFGLLAALLMGAALALPLVLDRVMALGQGRARGVVAGWFWADTRQQLPGLSLALAALLLAMAANVGVATMVSSFRLTFVGFLDRVLTSELYVYTADADQAALLEEWVTPRVDDVLPLYSVARGIAGLPSELYSARDAATYRENWRFLAAVPQVWDVLAAGEGVLVNEQLARRAGLALGDTVAVAADRALPVAGIYGDYGNPIGQAIVTEPLFRALYPDIAATRFGLRIAPEEVAGVRDALRDDFGLPAANIVDQAAIKAFSLSVFERTFKVTTALNVLTLAVAGFAMLMSLLTLATMRLPQLAPVWALGLTRRALGRYELLRAVLLAVLTAALALPLGLALAWVLLAVVNVAAFGWRLPMFFFPADYARLGLFALLAAGLAALWPALRLARTPPAVLLKVFSNER